MTGDTEISVASMTAAEWGVALSFYSSGYTHGISDGRDGMQAEIAVAHAHLATSMRKSASEPSHAQLVEGRRRHQLAAASSAQAQACSWSEEGT